MQHMMKYGVINVRGAGYTQTRQYLHSGLESIVNNTASALAKTSTGFASSSHALWYYNLMWSFCNVDLQQRVLSLGGRLLCRRHQRRLLDRRKL